MAVCIIKNMPTPVCLRHPTHHQMDAPVLLAFFVDQSKALRFELGPRGVIGITLGQLLHKLLLFNIPDTVPVRHYFVTVAPVDKTDVVARVFGCQLDFRRSLTVAVAAHRCRPRPGRENLNPLMP